MPRAPQASADFEQVLLFDQGPQVVLLSMGDKSKILGVSVNRVVGDHQYFGAKVSVDQFHQYLEDRFDLRYILRNPDRAKWFFFDLPTDDGSVRLNAIEFNDFPDERLLPEHGLFARDHTEDYEYVIIREASVQRFLLDGNWDMREFAKFHSQISDLYALTKSVVFFQDIPGFNEVKRSIVEAFIRPWQGGGSYLGFFKSLAKLGGREFRPNIKAIQWASPGYLDVTGNEESFERIVGLVDHYDRNQRRIMSAYSELWQYMSEMKLLKLDPRVFDRQSSVAEDVRELTEDLASCLDVAEYETVRAMAGGDALVAAKVLLASARRVAKLHAFFSEGRVAIPEDE